MTLQHPHAELSAYIDGELDSAAQAAVDGHLDACALCRAHVAQLRATAAFVRALPDPVPSRRLVPRLGAPAWLAPLRTLMTLASGAAVFLFIASALATNITLLAGGSAATTAQEASRDRAVIGQAPPVAQSASTGTPAPAPVPTTSPNAAFAVASTAPASPPQGKVSVDSATPETSKRLDDSAARASAAPGGLFNNNPQDQDAARVTYSAPQRSPLLNPWLWLALALICGAIAIGLNRRLRASA